MKYKFNIQPIYIEADSEQEAWEKYDSEPREFRCNDMEEID